MICGIILSNFKLIYFLKPIAVKLLRNNVILREDTKSVKFEDIFSNEQKREKVAKVFKQILDIYERNKKIVC